MKSKTIKAWEKSIDAKLKHERALLEQYWAWSKSNGRVKPKLIVGQKYKYMYPELYMATNPKAKEKPVQDWIAKTTTKETPAPKEKKPRS